jgi:hypothetical protein
MAIAGTIARINRNIPCALLIRVTFRMPALYPFLTAVPDCDAMKVAIAIGKKRAPGVRRPHKKNKQGQRPALDFQVLYRSPPVVFFGVAAIGRAAGFSSLRPGPHPPGGQQSSLLASLLRVDDSYLISFNLSSGLSCTAP